MSRLGTRFTRAISQHPLCSPRGARRPAPPSVATPTSTRRCSSGASLRSVDDAVVRILRTLRRSGELERTVVEGLVYLRWNTGREEVYDLRRDPLQVDGRVDARERPHLVRLRAALDALQGCRGVECTLVRQP